MSEDSVSLARELGLHLRRQLGLDALPVFKALPGAVLVRAGEQVNRLPYLLEGRLEGVMHRPGDDGEQLVPVAFSAGQIALLSTLFGSEPSPIDLVVLEPLRWNWLDRRQLEATLSGDPGGLLLLTRFLGARLREVQHRERGWLGRGLQVRLCAVLRRMVREAQGEPGRPPGDGPVRLRVTHERLAHRCGLSRPRTSQALKRLERAGAVRLGRGQIEVLDAAALHGGGPC